MVLLEVTKDPGLWKIPVAYAGLIKSIGSDNNEAPPIETPLPAALPLFAAGFGVVAFVARRKKRAQNAAA